MSSLGHSHQLAQILLASTSDDDFIEKIRPYRGAPTQILEKPVIGLSEGVLLLLGFFPGPWLNQIPMTACLTAKLISEWEVYNKAKVAIRGKELEAHQELNIHFGTIYYVKLRDLCVWFEKNDICPDPTVKDFVSTLLEPLLETKKKGRGRPLEGRDVILKIAQYFREKNITKITITDLKSKEHPDIFPWINEYLEGVAPAGKNRRLKTLREHLNKEFVGDRGGTELPGLAPGKTFCHYPIHRRCNGSEFSS